MVEMMDQHLASRKVDGTEKSWALTMAHWKG